MNFYELMQQKDELSLLDIKQGDQYRAFIPFFYESALLIVDLSAFVGFPSPRSFSRFIIPNDFDTSTAQAAINAWVPGDSGSTYGYRTLVELFFERIKNLEFRIRFIPGSDFFLTDVFISPIVMSYIKNDAVDTNTNAIQVDFEYGYDKAHILADNLNIVSRLSQQFIALREQVTYKVYVNTTQIVELLPVLAHKVGLSNHFVYEISPLRRHLIAHPIVHIPMVRPLRLRETDEVKLRIDFPTSMPMNIIGDPFWYPFGEGHKPIFNPWFQMIGIQLLGIRAFRERSSYEEFSVLETKDLVKGHAPADTSHVASVLTKDLGGEVYTSFVDVAEATWESMPEVPPVRSSPFVYRAKDDILIYAISMPSILIDMSVGGMLLYHAPKIDLLGNYVLDHAMVIPSSNMPTTDYFGEAAGLEVNPRRRWAYTTRTSMALPQLSLACRKLPLPLRLPRNYELRIDVKKPANTVSDTEYLPYINIVGLRRVEPLLPERTK